MSDDETPELSIRQSLMNLSLESIYETNLENDLLIHVLLPRSLPQYKRDKSYEHGLELMQRMVGLIELQGERIPQATIEMLRNMLYVQADYLPETICEQINALTPGKTFAMFVNSQNCVFVIYMPANECEEPNEATTVIVATFFSNVDRKRINRTMNDFEVG